MSLFWNIASGGTGRSDSTTKSKDAMQPSMQHVLMMSEHCASTANEPRNANPFAAQDAIMDGHLRKRMEYERNRALAAEMKRKKIAEYVPGKYTEVTDSPIGVPAWSPDTPTVFVRPSTIPPVYGPRDNLPPPRDLRHRHIELILSERNQLDITQEAERIMARREVKEDDFQKRVENWRARVQSTPQRALSRNDQWEYRTWG